MTATYLRIKKVGEANISKPSKQRIPSVQGSLSSHIHATVPNTTDLNAHIPLVS